MLRLLRENTKVITLNLETGTIDIPYITGNEKSIIVGGDKLSINDMLRCYAGNIDMNILEVERDEEYMDKFAEWIASFSICFPIFVKL